MVKRIKSLVIITVLLCLITVLSLSSAYSKPGFKEELINYPYIEQSLLSSSRYTTKEKKDPEGYQDFLDNYYLSLSDEEIEARNYLKYGENDFLILYFEGKSFSVLLKNKKTGYFWSSNAEFLGDGENRNEYRTGLWVNYVIATNITRNYLSKNLLGEKAEVIPQTIPGKEGLSAKINFKDLGFTFDIDLYLEGRDLVVEVPHSKIEEKLPRYRLISIQIFPYFGSARQNKYPGYMFIPDGAGALIRFNNPVPTDYYTVKYYGEDYGYVDTSGNRDLTAPVFGMIHDVYQNGFLGIIESGDMIADLSAYFWGFRNSNYFWISPLYNYREYYTNVIDRNESGEATVSDKLNDVDLKIRYRILSEEEADYVGMARSYKEFLEEREIIHSKNGEGNIPLALDLLMMELEPAFIGNRQVKMTSPADALSIYQDLRKEGIGKFRLNLLGWSSSGFIDRAPYKVKFNASKKSFQNLIKEVEANEDRIYFQIDYQQTSSSATRPGNSDLARRMSKMKMELKLFRSLNDLSSINFLFPDASLDYALNDYDDFQKLGINNYAFSGLGNTLFSYYQSGNRYHRGESLAYYRDILGKYGKSAFYKPNAYMFEYTCEYYSLPIYNSQHHFFTDLVPFLPIVLKGSIDYYSPYLNFNALGQDQVLNLIDFGVNPAFIIIKEPTTRLLYTKANNYYSTEYSNFRDQIIETYHYINDALKEVNGSSVRKRQILEDGIVAITYDNGKTIYVNYSSKDFEYEGLYLKAKDYLVI